MSEHKTGCQCTWCERQNKQAWLVAEYAHELADLNARRAALNMRPIELPLKYPVGDIFLTRRIEPEDATWAQSPPEPPDGPWSVVAALAEYDTWYATRTPPTVPDIPAGACPQCRTPGTGPGRLYCAYCDELRLLRVRPADPPSGGKPPRKRNIPGAALAWFAVATTGLCWMLAGFLAARPWLAGAGAFLFLFATRFLIWTSQ